METVNHECHVDIEVAKLLKEAGFDWEVERFYWYDKQERKYFLSLLRYNEQPKSNEYLAPTLEVAQRWLREVKNISVNITSTCYSEYEYIIRKINQSSHKDNVIYALTACRFYTYEAAQEAGIKTALEIILDKRRINYDI